MDRTDRGQSEIAQAWSAGHRKLNLIEDQYKGRLLANGPAVKWANVAKTQIRIIDGDHRDLVKLINKLAVDLTDGGSDKLIDLDLDQFNAYALEHFRREEELMRRYHYPDYLAHRETHLEFRRYFHAVRIVRRDDRHAVDLRQVLTYLTAWLTRHIGGSDVAYVTHIAETSVPPKDDPIGPAIGHSAKELSSILETVAKIITADTSQSAKLIQQIHDLQTEQALDMDPKTALGLIRDVHAD